MAVSPDQHGIAREFLAVVGPNDGGLATPGADLVQQAGQMLAADRMLRNDGYSFVCGVIDDG